MNPKAVDANPDGGNTYGVGDATIAKIDGTYYLYCDRETKDSPYKIVAWKTDDIMKPFELIGVAIKPRSERTQDWDNYRIQDGDLEYIPELGKFVMTCNMMDKDGTPGWPNKKLQEMQANEKSGGLKKSATRVIGIFYNEK